MADGGDANSNRRLLASCYKEVPLPARHSKGGLRCLRGETALADSEGLADNRKATDSCGTDSAKPAASTAVRNAFICHKIMPVPPYLTTQLRYLTDPSVRDWALFELSHRREACPVLAPLLWYSPSAMAVLITEIVQIYPKIYAGTLTMAESNRVCSCLALMQSLASHPEIRQLFLDRQVLLLVVPFVNRFQRTQKGYELLRLTALGVIGALFRDGGAASQSPEQDDFSRSSEEVVTALLQTEIPLLLLRVIESGQDICRRIAVYILMKLLLHSTGVRFIVDSAPRLYATISVLNTAFTATTKNAKSLHHLLRCYAAITAACSLGQKPLNAALPESLLDGSAIAGSPNLSLLVAEIKANVEKMPDDSDAPRPPTPSELEEARATADSLQSTVLPNLAPPRMDSSAVSMPSAAGGGPSMGDPFAMGQSGPLMGLPGQKRVTPAFPTGQGVHGFSPSAMPLEQPQQQQQQEIPAQEILARLVQAQRSGLLPRTPQVQQFLTELAALYQQQQSKSQQSAAPPTVDQSLAAGNLQRQATGQQILDLQRYLQQQKAQQMAPPATAQQQSPLSLYDVARNVLRQQLPAPQSHPQQQLYPEEQQVQLQQLQQLQQMQLLQQQLQQNIASPSIPMNEDERLSRAHLAGAMSAGRGLGLNQQQIAALRERLGFEQSASPIWQDYAKAKP